VGFEDTPGGFEYHDREVLNDHSYCCEGIIKACAHGEPPEIFSDRCRGFHFEKARVRAEDAVRLGTPLIFTEFGACSNTTACVLEITNSADAFDSQLASWAYWGFKGFGDFTTTGTAMEGLYDADGNLQAEKAKALARSYAYAFQGLPLKNIFERETSLLTVEYTLDTTISAPTEIFFNEEEYYSHGYLL